MDPDGLLDRTFQKSQPEPIHELIQREPIPQSDPGVLGVGGLVPSVEHGSANPLR